jgi:hypothetical protein
MTDEKEAQHAAILALRVPSGLMGWVDAVAAKEGVTRAEVTRRCLLIERQRQQEPPK